MDKPCLRYRLTEATKSQFWDSSQLFGPGYHAVLYLVMAASFYLYRTAEAVSYFGIGKQARLHLRCTLSAMNSSEAPIVSRDLVGRMIRIFRSRKTYLLKTYRQENQSISTLL